MSDIKIEKTAGGYKAKYKGYVFYSTSGSVWFVSDCVWHGNNYEHPLRAAFITQYIDPPAPPKPQPAPKFKVGDRVVCVDNYKGSPYREGVKYRVDRVLGDREIEVNDCLAYSSRFALAPKPQPTPPFKKGDRLVCVNAGPSTHRLTNTSRYVATRVNTGCDLVSVICDDGSEGGYNYSRFTLAPEPEVHSGDPREWEPGVYRSSDGTYLVIVDCNRNLTLIKESENYMSKCLITNLENYHRIAASISDIFIDGILDMESI